MLLLSRKRGTEKGRREQKIDLFKFQPIEIELHPLSCGNLVLENRVSVGRERVYEVGGACLPFLSFCHSAFFSKWVRMCLSLFTLFVKVMWELVSPTCFLSFILNSKVR